MATDNRTRPQDPDMNPDLEEGTAPPARPDNARPGSVPGSGEGRDNQPESTGQSGCATGPDRNTGGCGCG